MDCTQCFSFLRSAMQGCRNLCCLKRLSCTQSLGNQQFSPAGSALAYAILQSLPLPQASTSNQEGHRTKNAQTGNIRNLPGRIMIPGPSPYFRVPSKFQVFRVRSVKVSKRILRTLGLLKSPVVQQLHQFYISPASFECSHCFRSAQTAEMKKNTTANQNIKHSLHIHMTAKSTGRDKVVNGLLFGELILTFFNLMHDTRLILTAPQIRWSDSLDCGPLCGLMVPVGWWMSSFLVNFHVITGCLPLTCSSQHSQRF